MNGEKVSSLEDEELRFELDVLGYPGYRYLRGTSTLTALQFLGYALDQPELIGLSNAESRRII
jgi:hypothetical protein